MYKFLVVIALCALSVQAANLVERVQKIVDSNTEKVKEQIWIASYLAELNATNIPVNVKHEVLRNKDDYETKGDKFVKQLDRLVTDKGDVAKKCAAGKGDEVQNLIKTIQNKYDVCTAAAETFCSGLKSAFGGEFNRILGVYNEKSTHIIPDCVKDSKDEDKAELCVVFQSTTVRDEALGTINKLQQHLIMKFEEIQESSYRCRIGVSTKDGLREKILAVSKDIESCMKASA